MRTFAWIGVMAAAGLAQEKGATLEQEASALAAQYEKAGAADEALFLLGLAKEGAPKAVAPKGTASDAPVRALGKAWSAKASEEARRETDATKRRKLEARAEVLADLPAHLAALKRINAMRRAAGLAPVGWDLELSVGAQLHARYLAAHPEAGHGEDPSAPEYTAEGASAGMHSGLAYGDALSEGVDGLMSTLYHRVAFLEPGWRKAGTGQRRGGRWGWTCGVDQYSEFESAGEKLAVAWPPGGAREVPVLFCDESPDPVPGDRPAGYPVTLTFFGGGELGRAKAWLREGGREVACWLSSPLDPARRDHPRNADSVCLIPKSPLKAHTTYTAKVEFTLDGEAQVKEWSFTTSAKPARK